MRFNTSHVASLLVLHVVGAGFVSPSVIFRPTVVDSPARNSGILARQELTQTKLNLDPSMIRSVVDWLPKDNQSTYILKEGEVRRLELNSSHLVRAPLIITVSPCTRNLLWTVYHQPRDSTKDDWTLVREYKGGETDMYSTEVSSHDRYMIELRGAGGGVAAAAVSARGERGTGVRLRLRARSKRRLAASWDHSPIDPQATTYCVVASRTRCYTSLCAARHDCRGGGGPGGGGAKELVQDPDWSQLYNAAGDDYSGYSFKNYVRRKKYSRSTKMTDAEPVVACVGSRTHHIIENLDFSKTYHVSVFGVGRDRGAGALLAAGELRPRPPRPAARALRDGVRARAALRTGKTVFYFKTKPFSEGVWLGAVTCGGQVDIEVSCQGKKLHVARNVGPSIKFFVPAPRSSSSMQDSEETSFAMDSSSDEARLRYLIRVTPTRRRNSDESIVVESVGDGVIMMFKVLILAVATFVVCEGRIEVPGLESIEKCVEADEACVKKNADKIIKALSTPFPKYSIKGYDPIEIKSIEVVRPQFKIDQNLNDLVVSGFGDTKTTSLKLESGVVKETYEHDIKFTGQTKVIFRQEPEVIREGPISGTFGGVRSHFSYPYTKVSRDGDVFLEIGDVTLESVELPIKPELNQEQYAVFVSHPDTKELVQKVVENPLEFYKPVAEELVKKVYPQFFSDKKNFFKNVPLSELLL